MSEQPADTVADRANAYDAAPGVSQRRAARRGWFAYLELFKVRLVLLVLLTTLVGFLLGSSREVDWVRLAWTLMGTALLAGGANVFNQWAEAHTDARMARTRTRPLPSGRLPADRAAVLACVMAWAGVLLLGSAVNGTTAALGVSALAVYTMAYTPLKARTSLCTLVGAYAGAVPPVMGWAAASGRIEFGTVAIGAMLYAWQVPHFLSLAWVHRADYERAGVRVLSAIDPSGRFTCEAIVLYSLALVPLSLTVALAGVAGWVYVIGAITLGLGLLGLAIRVYRRRTASAARRLFLAGMVYLPIILGLMLAGR